MLASGELFGQVAADVGNADMNVARYIHTVRRLRPVQIWGRIWLRIYRPHADLRPPPPLRTIPSFAKWKPCARPPSMRGPSTFRFLGVERSLDQSADWNRADWPKLWLYNLHYFDDLNAGSAAERTVWHRSLVRRWIDENPPGDGNGWESYPTSLRVVNWIKWVFAGNGPEEEVRASLAVQARWLRQRLEIHLLGNHLWANAKALIFVGTFFEGPEADRWRSRGLMLLRRELGEQFLDDGGHFERSPMYHSILLEDLLDLVQLAALFPGVIPDRDAVRWRERIPRLMRWLRAMTHPDGGIAFFNDAAFDIAPTYADLAAYASSLGLAVEEEALAPIEAMPDSGYVRLEAGPAVLIADVGDIGPDYLPGHAHADTLSFELSVHGRRVLVNGGTSTYERGEERLRQRGTAAHNTVEVNGEDSSEVWSSFRVARRARPLGVTWAERNGELRLRAFHDGYGRLRGVGRVGRTWRLTRDGLVIDDRIEGRQGRATSRFHGHPAFAFDSQGGCRGILRGDGVRLGWTVSEGADIRIVPDVWHPRFGYGEESQALEVGLNGRSLTTKFSWK